MFVTEGNASRVICPHCRALNTVAGAAPSGQTQKAPSRPNIVLQERPNYSTYEASAIARQQIQELTTDYHNGWERISVNYDNVLDCYSKSYCLDKEKNEVFVTKAVGTIRADPQVIVDVYWNVDQEQQWNASTIQGMNVIEDHGMQQLVYQQHKTTSAATLRNDVTYRRVRQNPQPDGSIWCFSVSEQTIPETRANFRRGWVVFGGLLVEREDNGASRVSLVWCWDFNGWVHEKFILDEKKRVAIRVSKLAAQVQEYMRNPPRQNTYGRAPAPAASSSYGSSSGGSYQNPADLPQKAPRPQAKAGVLKGCKDCRAPDSGNYCSRCGNPTGSVCASCFTATTYSGDNCTNCGNKLREPQPSE